MRFSILLLLCLPLLSLAYAPVDHNDTGGIHFIENLSWNQVKEKAKKENKYIFVDCYATWCGPCKLMDKEVYTDTLVGQMMNLAYLSVKLQMDKTKDDDKNTQNNYYFADSILTNYNITAYPSLLFFSPDGKLLQKTIGYQPIDLFLNLARRTLTLTEPYRDPFNAFFRLLNKYRNGEMVDDSLEYMIECSSKLGKYQLEDSLKRSYYTVLSTFTLNNLNEKQIDFIANYINSKDKLFSLFYPEGKSVDSIMNRPNYSVLVVDNVIRKEEGRKFLGEAYSGYAQNFEMPKGKYKEIDWNGLYNEISTKYGPKFAQRNVLWAKQRWAEYNYDYNKSRFLLFEIERKYGIELLEINPEMLDLKLNLFAWEEVFKDSTASRKEIIKTAQIMSDVIKRVENRGNPPYIIYDTYANLLYKLGKAKKAITYEKKALNSSIIHKSSEATINEFKETLDKMTKNQPTW